MEIDHLSAFMINRGERLYDDEKPLNKNTPDLDFHRPIDDPAPYVVVVQGPRHVGKSLLIESLKINFHRKGFPVVQTPVTTTIMVTDATGKDIRLQFVECPDDINGMIDAAKYADVAILMVDASYGFEMETFEFRNLLQVHGFPKVIGVLTHVDRDCFGLDEALKVIPRLMDQFCTEICEGAKVFTLQKQKHNHLYEMFDINGLVKMLSDSQFLPLSWRAKQPYVLVDRFEDVTPERENGDKQFNRSLSLYGYLRGCDIKEGAKVHIAGAGDFSLAGVTMSYDPCPLKLDYSLDLLKVAESHFKDGKTGNYLRFDVLDVPSEIVEKLDPRCPILMGGILPEEENSGYMQVKLRRHSWRMDLLMTGAPITVSAGWRRYQTTAVYTKENENGQHRLLHYTPEHKDCLAVIWGPLALPKTKIVAVQDKYLCLKNKEAFCIMAKGVVLDFNREAEILLKVEKIGIGVQPCRKIAHIKFAPELKTDKLIGVPIQTKSGILGKIDEVAGKGIVKCTFEDYIRTSDTFLLPVLATLLLPSLFRQLNLLFKPLEIAVDCGIRATITATITAIDAAVVATMNAIDATITVKDELAVSYTYQEVAPRPQMLDLRRIVVIHDGKRGCWSLPNQLESFYSSVKREATKKRKGCVAGEISGEVDDDAVQERAQFFLGEYGKKQPCWEPCWEPVVINESSANPFMRRYGKPVPSCWGS